MSLADPTHDVAAIAVATHFGASAEARVRTSIAAAAKAPGIVWALDAERAISDARRIDAAVGRGERVGPLAGVPVAVKDSFDVEGMVTSLGLPEPLHVAEADAEAVRLLRASGAIVIGKTAMDQLAWSMSGQAPGRPACPNPARPGASPGGSSGGSAAAVAAGIVPLALGSDTACSVRVPASWCGVVGVKLSRAAVSMAGIAPLAPSFDSVGIVATGVAGAAVAASAMGVDLGGPSSPARRCRLGVPRAALAADPVFDAALDMFARAGHDVLVVDVDLVASGFGRLLAAEFATAWEGRLDDADVSDDIRAGLRHGARLSATGYLEVREALAAAERRARVVFDAVDLLVLPTTPGAVPPIDAPATVAEAARFTRAVSAHGWPAVSVPLPGSDGPFGLQLVAPPGADGRLLRLADELWDRPALSHRDPEGTRTA
jgi:Asp-tRNA(Asn)/Glu-tRNA(Gln) amidotransferase A subunit family amidase